ncbi:hypothetical protein Dimus_023968 [Dionaea muscipula]
MLGCQRCFVPTFSFWFKPCMSESCNENSLNICFYVMLLLMIGKRVSESLYLKLPFVGIPSIAFVLLEPSNSNKFPMMPTKASLLLQHPIPSSLEEQTSQEEEGGTHIHSPYFST